MKRTDKAEKISITLPPDMLNIIREKVKDDHKVIYRHDSICSSCKLIIIISIKTGTKFSFINLNLHDNRKMQNMTHIFMKTMILILFLLFYCELKLNFTHLE